MENASESPETVNVEENRVRVRRELCQEGAKANVGTHCLPRQSHESVCRLGRGGYASATSNMTCRGGEAQGIANETASETATANGANG